MNKIIKISNLKEGETFIYKGSCMKFGGNKNGLLVVSI